MSLRLNASAHATRQINAPDCADSLQRTGAASPATESSVPIEQDGRVTTAGQYTTIEERTFSVRFLLDPDTDNAHSVANVDAFVDLPDGSSWSLTIVSVDEVRRLLSVWREPGDVAHGSFSGHPIN
jgi:hypothetical protein